MANLSTVASRGPRLSRCIFGRDAFDYVLVPTVDHSAALSSYRVRESLFDIQDDLNELSETVDTDQMLVLQRKLEPWRLVDGSVAVTDGECEFTLGFRDAGNRVVPWDSYAAPVPTLAEAQRALIEVLRNNQGADWACILFRPSHPWEEPAGAQEAVTVVREHMRAAASGDVETLAQLATGPLLADIRTLPDADLVAAARGAYATAPTAMAFARRNARPGHHHVLANKGLHFDVDDSSGRWLILQVRLLSRSDRDGFYPWMWRGLFSNSPRRVSDACGSR